MELLKSTAPAAIKELHSKITKPEGVRYNPKKGEAPIDEGCELFDTNGSFEEDEEINSDNKLSDSEGTETADMNVNDDVTAVGSNFNDEVSKETNTNEIPSAPSCNLGIVNEIDQIVKKGREAGTNQLGVNSSEILLKLMGLFKIVLVVDDCGYYCVNYCILIKLCSVQRNYFSET